MESLNHSGKIPYLYVLVYYLQILFTRVRLSFQFLSAPRFCLILPNIKTLLQNHPYSCKKLINNVICFHFISLHLTVYDMIKLMPNYMFYILLRL